MSDTLGYFDSRSSAPRALYLAYSSSWSELITKTLYTSELNITMHSRAINVRISY